MPRIYGICLILILFASEGHAEETQWVRISGHLQTLNAMTRSTGLNPETADNPLQTSKEDADLFVSSERMRLRIEADLDRLDEQIDHHKKVQAQLYLEYDQRLQAGSFVNRGDFRIGKAIRRKNQAVDLSHTITDHEGLVYEQSLHRAYLTLKVDQTRIRLGRQQIPWGVGRFATPTDVFNPFRITDLEWDERDGVDAVDVKFPLGETKTNFVYTPRGETLHPDRYMARVSMDIAGYEVGILGGRSRRNELAGFDMQGNVGNASLRSELLYSHAHGEEDYFRYLVNMDYHFASGLDALLEYYVNGRGKQNSSDYELSRLITGEIEHLGTQYSGLQLGYDITPLIRLQNNTFVNWNDTSAYNRIELTNSLQENLNLNLISIWMAGNRGDEFGDKKSIHFVELEYFF